MPSQPRLPSGDASPSPALAEPSTARCRTVSPARVPIVSPCAVTTLSALASRLTPRRWRSKQVSCAARASTYEVWWLLAEIWWLLAEIWWLPVESLSLPVESSSLQVLLVLLRACPRSWLVMDPQARLLWSRFQTVAHCVRVSSSFLYDWFLSLACSTPPSCLLSQCHFLAPLSCSSPNSSPSDHPQTNELTKEQQWASPMSKRLLNTSATFSPWSPASRATYASPDSPKPTPCSWQQVSVPSLSATSVLV